MFKIALECKETGICTLKYVMYISQGTMIINSNFQTLLNFNKQKLIRFFNGVI